MTKKASPPAWAAVAVFIAGIAVLGIGTLNHERDLSQQQADDCNKIRELLEATPRNDEKIEQQDRTYGWTEPGSDAFRGCNEDAYEVRRIVDDLKNTRAQVAQSASPTPTTRGPGAAGGTLTDLVADLRGAGVDCTDWVTFDTTGSNRVIDSTASGMCRDQGITVALYQGGNLTADAAAQDRADRGASQMVWGTDWLLMFDHPDDYRDFVKYVDAR